MLSQRSTDLFVGKAKPFQNEQMIQLGKLAILPPLQAGETQTGIPMGRLEGSGGAGGGVDQALKLLVF